MFNLRFGLVWLTLSSVVALASANAADMYRAPEPIGGGYKDDPVPYVSWTGFYAGINGGYGWNGGRTVTFTPNDFTSQGVTCGGAFGGTCAGPASLDANGGLGGVQAGYNWQINRTFVVGFETDFDWSGIRGTGTSSFILGGGVPGEASNFQATEDVKWFGTVRGRLGSLLANNFLVYGTAGFAYGAVNENVSLNSQLGANAGVAGGHGYQCDSASNCFVGGSSRTAIGWTAGAGFEYTPWSKVSVKAEFLYVDLGSGDAVNVVAKDGRGVTPSSFTAAFGKPDFETVRVGLNYHFGDIYAPLK